MGTFKKIILFLSIIFVTTKGFSQDENKLPFSIYSSKTHQSFSSSTQNINTKLDLKDFNFLVLDRYDLENGIYSYFFSKNFGKKITCYVYDSYKRQIFNKTAKYYDPKNGLPFYYVNQIDDFK